MLIEMGRPALNVGSTMSWAAMCKTEEGQLSGGSKQAATCAFAFLLAPDCACGVTTVSSSCLSDGLIFGSLSSHIVLFYVGVTIPVTERKLERMRSCCTYILIACLKK